MRQGRQTKERLSYWGFLIGVFAFLLVFFLKYRPLIVDNMDDWTYLSFTRAAVPIWKYWNPSRILPEILMPACAQFAVWFVMPITGDFVWSVSIVTGVLLSVMITLYIGLFARLLEKHMHLSMPVSLLVCALFLVFHFRSWMSMWIPSQHVFYTGCVTTCYYYLIPALLNIVLVLLMEIRQNQGRIDDGEHVVAKGFLVVLLYLAVFSNLFSSGILAVYAGYRVLSDLVKAVYRKTRWKEVLGGSKLYLGILAAWIVSAVYEYFGNRAGNLATDMSMWVRIKTVIHLLLDMIEKMENTVFYLSIAILAAGMLIALLSRFKKPEDKTYAWAVLKYLVCAGVVTLYLILLSAASACEYIARMDVLICIVFYVFAAVFTSLAYLLVKWRSAAIVLPLVTFIIAFDVLLGIDTFAYSSRQDVPVSVSLHTSRAFMQQVLDADAAGMKEMTLKVPKCNTPSNWPYSLRMGGRIVTTLRCHDLIEHVEEIYIEPTEDFDAEFGTY